jgi:hypothetical protein
MLAGTLLVVDNDVHLLGERLVRLVLEHGVVPHGAVEERLHSVTESCRTTSRR